MAMPVIRVGWTLAKGSRALLTPTRIFTALNWAKTVIDLVRGIRDVPNAENSQPAEVKKIIDGIVPDICQYIAYCFYMQTRSIYETLGVKRPTQEEWDANKLKFPNCVQCSVSYDPEQTPRVQWSEDLPMESFRVGPKALLELPGWLPMWGQFEAVGVPEGAGPVYYYYSQEMSRILAWPWRNSAGNGQW